MLLLTGAEGTAYANFQHDWVEKMTEGTWTYYAEPDAGACVLWI